jgi:hypothetical protein
MRAGALTGADTVGRAIGGGLVRVQEELAVFLVLLVAENGLAGSEAGRKKTGLDWRILQFETALFPQEEGIKRYRKWQ